MTDTLMLRPPLNADNTLRESRLESLCKEQRSVDVMSPVVFRIPSLVVRHQGLHRSLELEDVDDLFDDEPRQRQHRRHRRNRYTVPADRNKMYDAYVLRGELAVRQSIRQHRPQSSNENRSSRYIT